jgi:hypothetical protein
MRWREEKKASEMVETHRRCVWFSRDVTVTPSIRPRARRVCGAGSRDKAQEFELRVSRAKWLFVSTVKPPVPMDTVRAAYILVSRVLRSASQKKAIAATLTKQRH